MTKKALEANALLCDNNTVKIHYVNQSDFLKINLAFLTRSLVLIVLDWRPTHWRLYSTLYIGELNHQQLDHNSSYGLNL